MKTKFQLTENFLSNYRDKQPEWGFGDLSYFVFMRTYSRTKEDGTKETPFEVFKRVVEGTFQIQLNHCNKMGLPWDALKAQKTAQKMFIAMWSFKFLPPGRGLWMMGTPLVDKIGSAALNNCAFSSTKDLSKDPADSFGWNCDMLMLGVGVGFNTKGAGTVKPTKPSETDSYIHEIEDSREGWVKALKLLITSYFTQNSLKVLFDGSKIRPEGSPIKGFGGTASGYKPLKEGLEKIRELLDSACSSYITDVQITDMNNIIGKFVVAGNVRRSAELAIGEEDSFNFIDMKNPEKYPEELTSHRWVSNNSIYVTPNSDFSKIVDNINMNGEPGLIFIDNARHYGRLKDGYHSEESSKFDDVEGFNPCAEQPLHDREMCCLVETFPANHDSPEEYTETIKLAYLYAKSVTLVPTHDYKANSVMLRNRRIGVSQSGIQQAIKKFGRIKYFQEYCDIGYSVVNRWDRIYSRWLGVPHSIRMTTVKPSGTVSLLAGATPGVHCTHSEFYLRTVRIASNDPLVEDLTRAGYRIEPSVTDEEGTKVVYFPVKEKNFTKSKYDISIWEQLALVRELQTLWSDNAVSVTITIRENEKDQLKDAIEYYAPYVKSLSFLPLDNHQYEQPPYQAITEEEYNDYSKDLKPLNISSGGSDGTGSKFCDGDKCEI